MGDFRIEVTATGGHGCQREKLDGETVNECDVESCPDCMARRFVKALMAAGNSVKDALLIHWPYGDPTVVDNLRTGRRNGKF